MITIDVDKIKPQLIAYQGKLVDTIQTKPLLLVKATGVYTLGIFLTGLLIGLFVLGWGLWPVQWVGVSPYQMDRYYQEQYVIVIGDLHAFDNDTGKASRLISYWLGHEIACDIALSTQDLAKRARLISLAATVNGFGCPIYEQSPIGE